MSSSVSWLPGGRDVAEVGARRGGEGNGRYRVSSPTRGRSAQRCDIDGADRISGLALQRLAPPSPALHYTAPLADYLPGELVFPSSNNVQRGVVGRVVSCLCANRVDDTTRLPSATSVV